MHKSSRCEKNLLGLNDKGEVKFKKNKNAYLVKALEDGAFGIKGAQQSAFRGLAADLLQTTVDKLKEAKEKKLNLIYLKVFQALVKLRVWEIA